MEDQILPSLHQTQPGNNIEWFLLKRIDEDPIEITSDQRLAILGALQRGDRYIQVGKYTIMVNSIKSIDPKYGQNNIPPRPLPVHNFDTEKGMAYIENQKEIDTWDKYYGKEGK